MYTQRGAPGTRNFCVTFLKKKKKFLVWRGWLVVYIDNGGGVTGWDYFSVFFFCFWSRWT